MHILKHVCGLQIGLLYYLCFFLSNVVTKGMRDYKNNKNKNNINNNK